MDAEEDTSSTSSGPSVSEKSNSAKRAESESPDGVISPVPSTGKSKPDRSNGDEPPCKIQKHYHTSSDVPKDPEASSESLKEEVPTSESPNTEDETPMEVDDPSPVPSDLKSEDTDKSATSSESLKVPEIDSTSSESEKEKDPVAVDEKLPRSPSPTLEVSCLSDTSDITLKTTESIVMDEDKTLNVSSTLTTEILNKPEPSEKPLEKQDSMNGNTPSLLQPDTSSKPETSPKSSSTQDAVTMEDEKLSPSIQSEGSSEPKQSADLKHQNQSLNGQGPCENLGTEELVTDEGKLTAASSCQPDISSEPGPSMNEDGNQTSLLQPDISSKPETSPKSLSSQDPVTMEDEKLSPSFQPDGSSEPKKSEDLKHQNQSLNGQGPCENLGTEELVTGEGKLTAASSCQASSCQPDISSQPGPSGEHLKTFESGILSQPGPSGEHLRSRDSTMARGELSPSSFNLDEGVIGNQSLDRATCRDIQAELDPRIVSNQILSTFYRLRDSYVRQRRQQADDARRRERTGRYSYEQLEGLENRDEISIRSWLKYALPREADYLNSIAGAEEGEDVPDPPSLEDDRTYSLSSGTIPEGDRLRWRRGIALGERILRFGSLFFKCTPHDDRSRPNRDYNFESQMTNDLMNLLNDLARKISDTPEVTPPAENLPVVEHLTEDSGNVSPSSLSFKYLPSVQEDNTSLGAASIRSEEEPLVGAVGGLSPRPPPRHDQVTRVLSQVSLDSESSDSITYYPKDGDTSSYKLQNSILDCPSIQDESDSASISAADNPKEDQVASDLAEVHLDNDESESACSLEVHLDENESPSDVAEAESESTAYPTSSETSSDQNCSYTAGRRKKEEDSEDGWC